MRLVGTAALGWLLATPVADAAQGIGAAPWTLAQDHSGRKCPVTLRFNAAGAAGELGMPAGCRRAVPTIVQARAWSIDGDGVIRLSDALGQTLLTFNRQSGGDWHAEDAGGQTFTLTPPSAAAEADANMPDMGLNAPGSAGAIALANQPDIVSDAPIVLDNKVVKLAAAPTKKAADVSDTSAAGRYAVMRGDRDTGCMVTLEADQHSGKNGFRARLAPACRDQNIVIFDPMSWQLKGPELMLTARKGHSISLDKDQNGTWVKIPKDVKALGLKPI